MSKYQSVMGTLSLHIWNQNISTSIGQPVDCEIAGYYVMADDECHELLSPRNITCSGSLGLINVIDLRKQSSKINLSTKGIQRE